MLNQNLVPAYLVGTAIVVMMASPSRAADALLPTQVAAIARGTVVRIEPTVNSPGSGVIIGRYQEGGKNVYVVLTAAHVVQHLDDEYSVVTPKPQGSSGQREKILVSTGNDIQKLQGGVDLAIVKFRSDRQYQVATLGDSNYTTEGAGVYIAGFPNPGAAIKRRVFQFTSSLVSSRLDADGVEGEAESQDLEGGYAISYTNVTRAGMSGGPVFDVAGRVVGIHGKGDRDRPLSNESSSETGPSNTLPAVGNDKTGFNLGIPIRSFLKLMSNTSRMGIRFDGSEPGALPGGGVIALRRGRRPSDNQANSANPRASNVPPTNIREEEETGNDIVVGQPRNRPSNSPTTPQNVVPRQPTPTPQNQTPAPSSPPPSRPGRFF